jgi:hypothetical protein
VVILAGFERDAPHQIKAVGVTGFDLKRFPATDLRIDQPAGLQVPQRV